MNDLEKLFESTLFELVKSKLIQQYDSMIPGSKVSLGCDREIEDGRLRIEVIVSLLDEN